MNGNEDLPDIRVKTVEILNCNNAVERAHTCRSSLAAPSLRLGSPIPGR